MSRSNKGKRHEKFFNQFSFTRMSTLESLHSKLINSTDRKYPMDQPRSLTHFHSRHLVSSTTRQKNPLFIFPADSFTENPYLRLISPRLQPRPLFTKTSRIRRALSRAFIKTLSASYSADQPSEGEKKRKRREISRSITRSR